MDRLSEVQDSDDDQDRITLSLGILDGNLSEEEEYSEQPSKGDRKSNIIQRSPTPKDSTTRRTPTPRRSSRASTRASTRGSEHLQACTTTTTPRISGSSTVPIWDCGQPPQLPLHLRRGRKVRMGWQTLITALMRRMSEKTQLKSIQQTSIWYHSI